ncbi:MAG TPA: hypothetical protein VM840_11870 [Actinomycetota bacterium]|nr:hypothetical protein [Actinomycetota bacterium]
MRRHLLAALVAVASLGLVPIGAPAASAHSNDCSTPNGGSVRIYSAYNPAQPVQATPDPGYFGCARVVYTEDGAGMYGVDTRVLLPGATHVAIRYVHADAGVVPGQACLGGLMGGCFALKRALGVTPSSKPEAITREWIVTEWIALPSGASGTLRACAHDACTHYDTADRYECSEAFLTERDTGVHVNARPCTNPTVTLPL